MKTLIVTLALCCFATVALANTTKPGEAPYQYGRKEDKPRNTRHIPWNDCVACVTPTRDGHTVDKNGCVK